jgi:hypothetical protein
MNGLDDFREISKESHSNKHFGLDSGIFRQAVQRVEYEFMKAHTSEMKCNY